MEAAYNEDKFKAHIRTVVEQAEGDSLTERPLTLSELKELAISMGLSEEEWDEMQAKAHIHLKLAQDHLKARNFNDAIADAEKATEINPYLPNSNSVLAKSYQMLWLEDEDEKAREKAEYYARKELLTDPNDQIAINVLSAINKNKKNVGSEAKTKKTFLIIGGGILLIGLLFYFINSSSKSAVQNNQLEMDLIVAQEDVNAKYDLVQTAIDQRNNMIPDLFNAVDGNRNDLSALNKKIDQLTAKLKTASGSEKSKLEAQLDEAIADAKKIAREEGTADNVKTLLIQIEGAENRIAFEKKSYNDAVKAYNILVKQNKGEFPQYEIQPYYNEE
jgi:hypothetical protein